MSGYGKRPYVYQHSLTEPRRGRPRLTADTGVLGLSEEQRALFTVMLAEPERWFTPADFDGADPHRYTKLARMVAHGLVERRRRGKAAWEYRVRPETPPS